MKQLLHGTSIFLVGMMGTGKTTLGQLLAGRLGYRFFDTDVLIERVAETTIDKIFATEGENYFRSLETKVLEQICAYTQSVIATGGGIILKLENWGYLHHGLIIWLDAPVEILVQRLQEDRSRPLLKDGDLSEKLTILLAERRSLYAQADLHIAIARSQQTPQEIVEEILDRIPSVLKRK
ncbi:MULTISPECIES: shikimate kinase [Spirulina sp. CCY15215]|uniref:shikimate kinase n=1 Tax=Spirulina sp. CCY15215 TaxID=2767591 RepID=UPI0032AFDE92